MMHGVKPVQAEKGAVWIERE
ncbi:hypothetical protein CL3_32990 [butyrate-producing bacterium SM4/1]|nr:hypothetical protein CL3_32990 [butyrate-producing bacterium SM4/1]